jgi:hypothetical protein
VCTPKVFSVGGRGRRFRRPTSPTQPTRQEAGVLVVEPQAAVLLARKRGSSPRGLARRLSRWPFSRHRSQAAVWFAPGCGGGGGATLGSPLLGFGHLRICGFATDLIPLLLISWICYHLWICYRFDSPPSNIFSSHSLSNKHLIHNNNEHAYSCPRVVTLSLEGWAMKMASAGSDEG